MLEKLVMHEKNINFIVVSKTCKQAGKSPVVNSAKTTHFVQHSFTTLCQIKKADHRTSGKEN